MANLNTSRNAVIRNARDTNIASLHLPKIDKSKLRGSARHIRAHNNEETITTVKNNSKPTLIDNALRNCKTELMKISMAENMLKQQQEMGKANSFEAISARDQMDKAILQLTRESPALISGGKQGVASANAIAKLSKAIQERNESASSMQLGGGTLDFAVRKELMNAQMRINSIK